MKTKQYIKIGSLALSMIAAGFLSSCANDFTDRPSEDSINVDNYYQNDEQVMAATDGLYYKTWFQFNNKFFYAVTEIGSGNMTSGSSDVNAMRNFSLNGSDSELFNGWESLWGNVAQSNFLINNLRTKASGGAVSSSVVDNAIGEAYFMRATAYFYLVRLWGPVPIITNYLDHITNPRLNTNRVEDIYKLIEMDYQKAIDLLPSKMRGGSYASNAKVSKGSAKAMLAKVYLYNKEYAKARQLAEDVINSGEFKLLGGTSEYSLPGKSFGDLFTYPNNNNEESIFALQWKSDSNYGSANNCNTQFGISSKEYSTSNASYGGVFAPSIDILDLYSSNDLRRNETLMLPGNNYPKLKVKVINNGILSYQTGFTVPAADEIGGQGTGAGIKKYCIGIVNGNETGPLDNWNMMDNNTYIMRYAELLLIHAEAILAGGSSTSDPAALKSINAVRNRAGLSPVTSFTQDDIFLERRKELAFEGDYWFDLGRMPRSKAIAIMSAQDRGRMNAPEYFTPGESSFILPYPVNDIAKNPLLLEAPVPYQF